jgi:hypothetical protein
LDAKLTPGLTWIPFPTDSLSMQVLLGWIAAAPANNGEYRWDIRHRIQEAGNLNRQVNKRIRFLR